ncbi:hypothetical protein ABM058_17265 [Morganella morganii]|uniref:hypothetical protein n=1 Tax=Morganella morganii TaxID=582 RepID=UPI003EB6F477
MINFENRLAKLKERRHGSISNELLKSLSLESRKPIFESIQDAAEGYELLTESSAVKYTIGAMSEVNPDYTDISKRTGERVAETLSNLLQTDGIMVVSRMQGSVPLNIHIKGHSDVDMLIIKIPIVLVQTPQSPLASYSPPTDTRPMVDILKELRELCEEKLTNRYHAVTVDCDNSKSIAMEGGSLQRKVDVVPACWFDNIEYQESQNEVNRGVKIYDKKNHELIGNSPFKHMDLVEQKDKFYIGNLKKLVRLLKNLVADMPDAKNAKAKKLSSFDLVSIVYSMNDLLECSEYTPLLLVDKLLTKLNQFVNEPTLRDSQTVPDKSRVIFDNNSKIIALGVICDEVQSLRDAIYRDVTGGATSFNASKLGEKIINA